MRLEGWWLGLLVSAPRAAQALYSNTIVEIVKTTRGRLLACKQMCHTYLGLLDRKRLAQTPGRI